MPSAVDEAGRTCLQTSRDGPQELMFRCRRRSIAPLQGRHATPEQLANRSQAGCFFLWHWSSRSLRMKSEQPERAARRTAGRIFCLANPDAALRHSGRHQTVVQETEAAIYFPV